jgi:anthranilate phosphoribosyltransferase
MDRDTNKVVLDESYNVLDNAGTGMDRIKTFNISSLSAIVAAACGCRIARHASRAITSRFGSVDVLERVGVGVDVDVETVANSVREAGIGLFNGASPLVHPLALGRILNGISFGSILNLSASLANPACPRYAVRGVYDPAMINDVAELLKRCGYKRAMILVGLDGKGKAAIDEASVIGATIYATLDNGVVAKGRFTPEDFGIKRADASEIEASSSIDFEEARFLRILSGNAPRAQLDIVVLNAALALWVCGRSQSIERGLEASREAIERGAATRTLRNWVASQNNDPAGALNALDAKIKASERLSLD